MKKKYFAILLLTILSSFVSGQSVESKKEIQAKLSKLSFLEGEWVGSGWAYGSDGIINKFNQTEKISFKLDQTLILIEGNGMLNRKISHDALAIISYNAEKKHFNIRSYMANGMCGDFKAELIENKLYWYPYEGIRYIICLNEKGQWYEKGEMKCGENWMQFFEMTLYRKDMYMLF